MSMTFWISLPNFIQISQRQSYHVISFLKMAAGSRVDYVWLLLDHARSTIVSLWRDVLETVINRRKLTDAQANPSTQRKRYLSPI